MPATVRSRESQKPELKSQQGEIANSNQPHQTIEMNTDSSQQAASPEHHTAQPKHCPDGRQLTSLTRSLHFPVPFPHRTCVERLAAKLCAGDVGTPPAGTPPAETTGAAAADTAAAAGAPC